MGRCARLLPEHPSMFFLWVGYRLQSVGWDRRASEMSCIEWEGCKLPAGYGKVTRNGRSLLAHRVAYIEAHGEIPEGMLIHHRCENPSCVNPNHLEAMSKREHQRLHLTRDACSRCGGTEFYRSGEKKQCRECAKRRARERYRRLTWT